MNYIGGYTSETNRGIYQVNDELKVLDHVVDEDGTSYFTICDNQIITILKRNEQGGIAIFEQGQEKASFFDDCKPGCYIEKHGESIVVAYYHDAQVKIFNEKCEVMKTHHYPAGSKPHFVGFFNQGYYVICLGLDEIKFYDNNHQSTTSLKFPTGSGPRHAVVTHDETIMFVLSELSNQLFVVDLTTMTIQQTETITQHSQTSGAAIRLSQDEKHLYASTRGADEIVHYTWNTTLAHQQTYRCDGSHPRDFLLLEDAVIVGYQGTPKVEKILLDVHKNLSEITQVLDFDKIVCIK